MSLSDPHDGTGDPGTPDGAELYGNGPWMVIESTGPLACELTSRAVAQCQDRGVRHEVVGIDKLNVEEVGVFHGMVVTVPDQPSTTSEIKSLFDLARAMRYYRAIRRDGIDAVLSGRLPEYKTGVLQIAGRSRVLNYHRFKQLERSVCREHRIDLKSTLDEVDFFSVYSPGATLTVVQSQIERNHIAAWELLLQWGITDVEAVAAVRVVFEECIQFYEDPKFTALFRPVLDSGLNRLQYVLFDPTFPGPIDAEDLEGGRKRWMEAGARVARYVLAKLNELDPAITRPSARRGRGLQEDLFALYATIETVMRTPEFKAILFPPSELPTEEGPTPPTASVHE